MLYTDPYDEELLLKRKSFTFPRTFTNNASFVYGISSEYQEEFKEWRKSIVEYLYKRFRSILPTFDYQNSDILMIV